MKRAICIIFGLFSLYVYFCKKNLVNKRIFGKGMANFLETIFGKFSDVVEAVEASNCTWSEQSEDGGIALVLKGLKELILVVSWEEVKQQTCNYGSSFRTLLK